VALSRSVTSHDVDYSEDILASVVRRRRDAHTVKTVVVSVVVGGRWAPTASNL
jgi:hypothetical protein